MTTDSISVRANWRDNPWFPPELEAERLHDLANYPDRYDHVWEGDYQNAFEGAYFAKHLVQAKGEGRISRVAKDPLLPMKCFFDLGGTGAKADALAIWVVQFVGREIRVLDYIEASVIRLLATPISSWPIAFGKGEQRNAVQEGAVGQSRWEAQGD